MLAVPLSPETWAMLVISVALRLTQHVDRFNDRALRPIPGASRMWCGHCVPQVEQS